MPGSILAIRSFAADGNRKVSRTALKAQRKNQSPSKRQAAHLDGAAWRSASWLFPAAVIAITLVAFLPVLDNGFVNWDDDKTLLDNVYYRGFGWPELRWMFTSFHMGHYQPLTWLSFALDHALWGMDPFGYHLTSLLLHVANAVLFYFLASRLLSLAAPKFDAAELLPAAAGAAALCFAVHPLRVESVAWATERRDLLSGFFLLLTLLCYLQANAPAAVKPRYRRWIGTAVLCYGCSLLSKAIGVTLPVILLVIDVYPLKRLGGASGWRSRATRRVWFEKFLFVALALPAAVVAPLAQYQSGALKDLDQLGIGARLVQASYGLIFYLSKTLLPIDLSPLYSIPKTVDATAPAFLISGALVTGLTAAAFLLRRRWPAGLALWICYAVMLAPVSGLLQSGPQFVADRYSYHAAWGWALLFGAAVLYLFRSGGTVASRRARFITVSALLLVVVSGLGFLTWKQTLLWHDSERLWRYALAVDESSSFGRNNLGNALSAQGKLDEAAAQFARGLQTDPADADLWYNLGNVLARQGKYEAAATRLRQALVLRPAYADAHYDLGNVRAAQGNVNDAMFHYRAALRIDPGSAKSQNNLAALLAAQGKDDEAISHYRAALALDRHHLRAHYNLALLLAKRGESQPAIEHLREAIAIKNDFAEAHQELGRLLEAQGKLSEAVPHYQQALRILRSRR